MIEKFLFTTAAEHHFKNEAIRESWSKIRERNQGWKIAVFSDLEQEQFLIQRLPPRILSAYQAINPTYGAAKADFFRYCACFFLGGVYIDVKSHISSPLDDILRNGDQFLISQWDNRPGQVHDSWGRHQEVGRVMGGEFIQWFIAAKSKHPFLRAVIQKVVRNIEAEQQSSLHKAVGWKGVLKVTGPIAFTQAISAMISQKNLYQIDKHYRYFNFWDHSCHYSIFEDQFLSNIVKIEDWKSLADGAAGDLLGQYKQKHYSENADPIILS